MNQHQLTMTRGDDRSFAIVVDDDYEGDTFTFTVDDLFTKTGTVGSDDGSGYATATVDVAAADTEGCSWDYRHHHAYSLKVAHDGDTRTIRRGLFVVTPHLEEVD